MGYTIIEAETVEELKKIITEKLKNGWKPFGNLVVIHTGEKRTREGAGFTIKPALIFFQPLIKE